MYQEAPFSFNSLNHDSSVAEFVPKQSYVIAYPEAPFGYIATSTLSIASNDPLGI